MRLVYLGAEMIDKFTTGLVAGMLIAGMAYLAIANKSDWNDRAPPAVCMTDQKIYVEPGQVIGAEAFQRILEHLDKVEACK